VRGAAWLRRTWDAEQPSVARLLSSDAALAAALLASLLSFDGMTDPNRLLQLVLIRHPPNVEQNAAMVRLALVIRGMTRSSARVAVEWAGAIPYFSECQAIDLLGKNDAVISHERMRLRGLRDFRDFMPGHNKWDLDYSVGVLQPDLISQLRLVPPAARASAYERIRVGGFEMLARRGSTNIDWEKVERDPEPP